MNYSSLRERLESRLVRTENDCLVWIGPRHWDGYGYFKHAGRHARTHRVAYELAHGPIPDGAVVMHTCDNPPCCNPDHLRAGTQRDNVADAIDKGRFGGGAGTFTGRYRTHCKRGHELTASNTYSFTNSGGTISRRCKTCHREVIAARHRRKAS
ncbi:HNH endonuclease signature motif containing protein [Microbacterium sp. GXS0129]|uniref:HNH endonuclease signature motif containing protein n=1 Tax=Microbacterium sp. GXS0129 TaxID=3377836 RepID=UPI00383A363E